MIRKFARSINRSIYKRVRRGYNKRQRIKRQKIRNRAYMNKFR